MSSTHETDEVPMLDYTLAQPRCRVLHNFAAYDNLRAEPEYTVAPGAVLTEHGSPAGWGIDESPLVWSTEGAR